MRAIEGDFALRARGARVPEETITQIRGRL